MLKNKFLHLAAAALVIALLALLLAKKFMAPAAAPAYITAAVATANIEDTVLASGTLKAFRQVSVGSQVSGQVKSLKVKLGDDVKQGELVAEIDSLTQQNTLQNAQAALSDAQAQLLVAQATYAQNQLTLKRQQAMRAEDASSQADLEAALAADTTARANVAAAQAKVQQARIAVDTAQVNLGYTRITSPISGQVVAIVTEEGTTVNANQATPTIIIVAQVDTMTIKASISEADVTSVTPDQRVYFTILGEPDRRYDARLRTIEPATDSISTTTSTSSASTSSTSSATAIYYNGLFDVANPDRKLRISMTATVSIVRAEARGALVIPVGALSARGNDGAYTVSVLGADQRLQQRRIKVGINNHINAQVLSGLRAGELVVLGNAAAAQPGSSMRRMGPPGGL
jgi:macrolide-specific efflux system membrane fusion protein